MNVFNRVLMVVAILVLALLVVLVMVDPLLASDVAVNNIEAFKGSVFDDTFYYTFIVGGGVLVLLILLVLLWLEIRRTKHKTVRIRSQGRGTGQLGVDSVAQSLEYRIGELPGVLRVEPRVISRGRDAQVVLNLDTSPVVNISMLTEQVVEMTHDILEGQLGLKVHGKVKVNIKHEPYPRGAMPTPLPSAGPAAEPAPVLGPELEPYKKSEVQRLPPSHEEEGPVTLAEEEESEEPEAEEDTPSSW